MRFINALVACSVIAITSSSVLAQSTAVQWTTASGGNGHWYEVATTPRTFFQARDWAVDNGGSLVLIDSSQENQFLFQLVLSTTGSWNGAGPFFGLFQDPSNPSFSEPNGGWIWVDGTPRSGRFNSFCLLHARDSCCNNYRIHHWLCSNRLVDEIHLHQELHTFCDLSRCTWISAPDCTCNRFN